MSEKYWKRVGCVSINGTEYGGGENALDFKFSIRKTLASQRFEASIGILGLSMETIHDLASWQPWNVAVAREREIKVYAGYEGDSQNDQLIFSGYIIEAKPTSPPEMWLNIKADNLSFYDKKVVKQNSNQERMFTQIVSDLAKSAGLRASISSEIEDKSIRGAYFNKVASEIPSYVETLHDVFSYVDEGVLYVVPRRPANYPRERGIYTLDMDSGLLGIASIEWSSLVARMRLDTRFRLNDFVWIDSKLYPENATGAYLVNEVEYKGHLRGQEWETVIHAWNYTPESQQIRNGNAQGK